MTEQEWAYFIASGQPQKVAVGNLAADICKAIGSSTPILRLHHDCTVKSCGKHGLTYQHFMMLLIVLDFGRVVLDRPRSASVFFFEEIVFGCWLHAVVKTTRDGMENWISTFHISSHSEVRRQTKKYGIFRPEKY